MSALDWIMEDVRVYRAWQAPFVAQKFAPVLKHNDLGRVRSVLDLACGPGTNARYFAETNYLGIDWNPAYVRYARHRFAAEFVVGDVCQETATIGRRFDFILANSFFHHINDDDARAVMTKMAALLAADGYVHIIDMVLPSDPGIARYLATHDRGRFPRDRKNWERLLCESFDPVVLEPYRLTGFGLPLWHMLYFKGQARS